MKRSDPEREIDPKTPANDWGIAILGMSGRFPNAANVKELWRNLEHGVESIAFFSEEEALAEGFDPRLLADPSYVRAAGVLEGFDLFDAGFFGFTAREAEITDPQQRLFLECAWEALEDAGYAVEGQVAGVFAGTSASSYASLLQANPQVAETMGRFRITLGNDKDYLSSWVSYKLNLKGPAITVQTACSTSLVAVHLACQSLLNGECDLALAGGVSVSARQKAGYLYQEGGINSPDGHCRTFDARGQGTVGGSGVAVVVLKRLADALEHRDPIRAVLRGSAINNDGAAKVGYTAPSVEGQARVIAEALAIADVDPETISYVEAHGTGTPLGDPVEVEALTRAFRARTRATGFCALGSVKTNIGHLDAAAGATGLIKTVLALQQGKIPPSLHFERPNPQIELEKTPFFVNSNLLDWPVNSLPRRAGVSSFGIGGTNAHVIVEEAPPLSPSGPSRPSQLLLLSAKSESALDRMTEELAAHLRDYPEEPLADVAYTLQVGRTVFEHRRMLVCSGREDALAALSTPDPHRLAAVRERPRHRPVVFLFPGQGAQFAGMGSGLYRGEPVFRDEVDRCAETLRGLLGFDLRTVLFPSPEQRQAAEERLTETAVTQPALLTMELALARLWMSWGVQPEAMIGHSVGQYAAACLAGVLSQEDALALVAARGRLVGELPRGAMLAVRLGESDLASLLSSRLSLAAVNAPDRCVVAGPQTEIAGLVSVLSQQGIESRALRTSHAFHSELIEPVLAAFRLELARVKLSPPRIPFLSNLTGSWITAEEATSPDYWVQHLRRTVRFGDSITELMKEPDRVFLEVGPGSSLGGFARRSPECSGDRLILSTLVPGDEGELGHLLRSLGYLWMAGVPIDWDGFYASERRCRIPLPTYPFERQRYWVGFPQPGNGEADLSPPALRLQPAPVESTPATRRSAIERELLALVSDLVGIEPDKLDGRRSFLEAGVDSLLLIQMSRAIESRFGVKITLARLLEEVPTLEAVVSWLEGELEPEAFALTSEPPARVVSAPAASLSASPAAGQVPPMVGATPLERVVAEQLRTMSELMARQLDALRAAGVAGSRDLERIAEAAVSPPATSVPPAEAEAFVPYEPFSPGPAAILDPHQQAHLEAFIARYTRRTAGSKRLAQEYRGPFADNRNSAGFRLALKEIIYPLAVDRARGSRIFDLDGNEYVDLTMGFGVSLFGHSPDFVNEALRRQLDRGLALGPQSDLAGEVARRLCRLTGNERAAFCNSGTEAVMAALRLARTATSRDRIALFAGAYHGIADATLARAGRGGRPALPVAPGVPVKVVEDVLVLPYGEPATLDMIEAQASELAAVLVEPVQSRRPDLQPREFLLDLRRLTSEKGIALIFDEMITGFRCHPGGAQAHFGVRADLTTYGKVLGGGLPLGVVAGRSAFMDGVDGGAWSFGDASYPSAIKTYFAGTFCKHPLAMASALAVLEKLEQQGPALQEGLTRRTAELCRRVNAFCQEEGHPLHATHFASLFRMAFPERGIGADLFFYHLLDRGVYVWEGRTSFVSTAHTDEDLERVENAIRDSLGELRAQGFFPPSSPRRTERQVTRIMPEDAASQRLPLTEGQRQIWFVAQLGEYASRAYNESITLEFTGSLDPAALGRAVRGLAARHEALRITFDRKGEFQTVWPAIELALPLVDLSAPGAEVTSEEVLRTEAARPFDLVRGPLVRALLVRLSAERHLLALTLHHLIVDGWSFGVLLRELAMMYNAELRGVAHALPEPPRFSRHVLASAEAGQAEVEPERDEEESDALELPLDRPRPQVRTFRGGRIRAVFGPSLLHELRRLGAGRGSTLTTTLLAGFAAFLHRVGGQQNLTIGLASAGQPALGADRLVGYCIHLLGIPLAVDSEISFGALLERTRKRLIAAHEGRAARKNRDPRRLLPHAAVLNVDRAGRTPDFSGLETCIDTHHPGAAKFEAYLNFVETPAGLALDWEYDADLFFPATVRRMIGHLATLLEGAAADPEQRISDLAILSEVEQHHLTREWNDTADVTTLADARLHEIIEARAERDPKAVAVVCEKGSLTYDELDRRADALARRLGALGAGPEVLVGICAERSLELVVGLLAILKAGAAYVPFDPSYPDERLAAMLEDARAPLMLVQEPLTQRMGALIAGRAALVPLVADGRSRAQKRHPSRTAASAGHAAYVIFTSGSTGRPKGAVNSHRAIVNRLLWMQQAFGLTPEDRVLHKTPFSFDVSVWELFWPLLVGARLVVARPDGHQDPAYLIETIVAHGITTLHFVPPMLQVFLEERGLERCTCLRRVIASGEALSPDLAQRFAARLGEPFGVELHNLYGPTEAAVDVTWQACSPADGRVPIGRPVANTHIHLLDARWHPVPLGVVGELNIGGVQVGRGYAHRPELTAERFVPDPFGEPGARLYRTGDLARHLPGGEIEYLGRIDHQVKVRGFRIELGEIESVLAGHPEVREAVVLVREEAGDRHLAAYVVPAGAPQQSAIADALRSFLAAILPDYMVPLAWVLLDALPLTSNGKVDRKALARIAPERRDASAPLAVFAGPEEELLGGIWAGVLGLESVSRSDDFFDLGGHSLLATRVVSRVREVFDVELPMRALFETPILAALAKRIETLRLEQRVPAAPPLRPVPREGAVPLSFAQERLWFLDQLEPDRALYNMPVALRLEGELDESALAYSLAEVVRRHEVLRTTFAAGPEGPRQVVSPTAGRVLGTVDLRGLPEPRREPAARGLAIEQAVRPFDLSCDPLLRAALVRLAAREHVLLVTMHHIVSDGWSMEVLVREVAGLYAAYRQGQTSPLAELPVQYADFALWQRSWLRGEALASQLAYWRGELAGAPAVMELPTDRPRPAVPTFRGASVTLSLPRGAAAISALARREAATPFMVALAALQALLHRITGQDDIVVGTPIAGRNRRELEGLIGFFVNTLVLRSRLDGDLAWRDLLGRARGAALDAYAYQDLPFERLVNELGVERSLSYNPVFQAMLAYQNAPAEVFKLPGLSLRSFGVESAVTKFDLSLVLAESGGDLSCALQGSLDLFDRTTARRLLGSFEVLLEGALAEPGRRVSELPLLSSAQRQQLLVEWNDTMVEEEVFVPVHQLFEEQARKTPELPAVIFDGESLSYAELDRRSGGLARRLRDLGVGPEVLVGLFVERSVDLPVAMLGIWKAGGAYVPLDPAHPAERLAFFLQDSQAELLLTQKHLLERMPEHQVQVALVDGTGEEETAYSAPVPATSLAYVFYTSGTTGRPKGVMIEHGQFACTLAACRRSFDFQPGDLMPSVVPFTFDIFLFDLLNPLLSGGTSELVALQPTLDVERLTVALEERATHFQAVPTILRQVNSRRIGSGAARRLGKLRSLFTGGEAVPRDVLTDLSEVFPAARTTVLYGPTEATLICSLHVVPPGSDRGLLGHPLPGMALRLLDRDGNDAPAGVTGEIWIGGGAVGRGYLNRPELTAERFVPGDRGARWYRTGDLARRLPSGEIEFLGRTDQQVKVRGFRIEPGEIQARLASHPEVRQAVVLAVGGEGEKRLVGYVVPQAGAAIRDLPQRLRELLGQSLPNYMVPTGWVLLDALPLTPNGKVDRRKLAALEPSAKKAITETGQTPRTPTEDLLAAIWAELLEADQVGPSDHFFELGGHSLLAIRAAARTGEAFKIELPVRALFERPVLSDLAAEVDRVRAASLEVTVAPVQTVPRTAALPQSFAQERLWFLDQLAPGSAAYNISTSVRLSGRLGVEALAWSLSEIVRRHEALRTRFAALAGDPVQWIEPPVPVPTPVIDLADLPSLRREPEAVRLAAAEGGRPFDLAGGSLLRAGLLRLGAEDHVLLITVHHIASDGWSIGILVRELQALYQARLDGRPSPLPELPVQYADFAVWQRQRLTPALLEAELTSWRERLRGAPPFLDFPTDRPRPAVRTTRGGVVVRLLGPEVSEGVRGLCRRRGTTLFMGLLAAFQALLHRASGQDDIVVGTPIANRSRPELEGLIGFFVNTLVMRTDLSGRPSFLDLLGRVRETALFAYAHPEVPFEHLVAELAPERSLSFTPLFQAMLVFQSAPPPQLGLAGLEPSPLPSSRRPEQFGMMTLSLAWEKGSLAAALGYNRDLFDPPTMARLLAQLQTLLAAAASGSAMPVSEIPLLMAPELHQVCREWNDSQAKFEPALMHDRIAAQAQRTPDAVAALFRGDRLSYGDLDRRANQLARHLRALGAGPEVRIGLCLERSFNMVIGLLGILKAGAAFLPLDPAAPRERTAFTLADAGITVLVTETRWEPELPSGPWQVVRLDADHEAIARHGAEDPCVAVDARNLAYVIYTSGSTGRPKGVLIEHSSLSNIVCSFVTSYGLSARDRVLQQTTVTFDVAVNEIFPILTVGGGLVLAPGPELLDFELLLALLLRDEVSILGAAPSVLARLNEVVGGELGSVRLILSGGEALSLSDVDRLLGKATVTNGYGPTEATVCALSFDLARFPGSGLDRIPIGRPIANDQAIVLDCHGNVLGSGIPGELCIAGQGLARGYLGNPAATAEKFVPHPQEPGARIYRTGDLARWLASGDVEFLGRIDHQVKIRGFRIEPGEIEAALREHPVVREAVVVAREEGSGDRRLVAYVEADTAVADLPAELRTWLRERLPAYMVPSAWVCLEELPRTASGKVDRGALPAPVAATARDLIAPRDEAEEKLAAIWSELLGGGPVSVEADFFDLGGHSLLAVRLMALIQRRLGRTLPLAALFQAPTIAELARLLAVEADGNLWSPLVALQPAGSRPPFFCVHPIGGEVIAYHTLARRLGPDQPFYALQAPGLVAIADRPEGIGEMAERYLEEVRHIQPHGPYLLGGWSFGCVVAFEMAQQLQRAGEEVGVLALFDGGPPRAEDVPRLSRALVLAQLVREDARQKARQLDLGLDELESLSIAEGIELVLRRAQEAGVVPPEIDVAHVERLLVGFQARGEAMDRYRPEVYPGPITFFRSALRDDLTALREGEADHDSTRGWSALSACPVEVHTIETYHDLLMTEPYVGQLADQLAAVIGRALRGERTACSGESRKVLLTSTEDSTDGIELH